MKSAKVDVRRARLRLHRETLRVIEGPELRAAAGGAPDSTYCVWNATEPKSNAWTGGADVICNN